MLHTENILQIEISDSRVWIPYLRSDAPHAPISQKHHEEVSECFACLNHNAELGQFASAEQTKALLQVFQAYGYQLYLQLFSESVRRNLHRFSHIQIECSRTKQPYFYELLFDGQKFLFHHQPIYLHRRPKQKRFHRTVKRKVPPLFGYVQGVNLPVETTQVPICMQSNPGVWSWLPHSDDQNMLLHFPCFSQDECLSDYTTLWVNPPEYLFFSVYGDHNGIKLVDKKRQAGSFLSWSSWQEKLKIAVSNGLKGLIFQCWHSQTNQPMMLPSFLPEVGLNFALEVRGNLSPRAFLMYFSNFLDCLLVKSHTPRAAHFKSLAQLSLKPECFFDWMKFRFIDWEKNETNLSAAVMRKMSAKPVYFPQKLRALRKKNPLYCVASNQMAMLQQAYQQNPKLWAELYTDIYFPIHDIARSWILRQPLEQQSNWWYFPSLFNSEALLAVQPFFKFADAPSLAFFQDLWNQFILSYGRKQQRINHQNEAAGLLIFGDLPQGENFQAWFQSKKNTFSHCLYCNSKKSNDREDLIDNLLFQRIFSWLGERAEPANKQPLKNAEALVVPYAENPLWQKWFVDSGNNQAEMSALPIADFAPLVHEKLMSHFDACQLKIILLLQLFRCAVPRSLVHAWLGEPATQVQWRQLEFWRIVQFSYDEQYVEMQLSYVAFFDDFPVWNKAQIQQHFFPLLENFLQRSVLEQEEFCFSTVFVAYTNLAEFLSYLGDYGSALRLLFHSKKLYWAKSDFSPEKLFLWGMTSLNWMEKLPPSKIPNLGIRIWRNFFIPILEYLPPSLANHVNQAAIHLFGQKHFWGAYALATASLVATMAASEANEKLLQNLSFEALETAKSHTLFVYWECLFILLKAFAYNKRLHLFNRVTADWEEFSAEHPIPADRAKDRMMLDLWHFFSTQEEQAIATSVKNILLSETDFPSQFEQQLLQEYIQWAQVRRDWQGLKQGWEKQLLFAIRLQDDQLKKQSFEQLIAITAQDQDWKLYRHYCKELLEDAMQNHDFVLVKKIADILARIYYQMGDKQAYTYYYGLLQSIDHESQS